MVIDIGGGTTDVAVISLGSCVVNESVKVAGDHFDEAIIRFMRRKYNVLIGERTAEELKINIGSAFERDPVAMDIRGRNLVNGLPKNLTVTSMDMQEALAEPVSAIVDTVHRVLEQTPPELSSDLSDRGVVLTGGSSLLHGLDRLITHKTGIRAIVADDAISAVAYGTGKYIEFMTSQTNKASDITRSGLIRGFSIRKDNERERGSEKRRGRSKSGESRRRRAREDKGEE